MILTKGYYGCIEAQGRGTLHCHMMIWLEGDPHSDFCRRLIAFLDDTISNHIPKNDSLDVHVPSDDFHPCSVRGTQMKGCSNYEADPSKAVRKDLRKYKYCKGNSTPKECRFGLHESNLNLRCLDGLVNNFNKTILHAIRCNMDIKFIGSGASAKALKAHIAYAALERAVRRLDEQCPTDSQLLQNQQELSAQQVNTYLLDLDDHFTSHHYKNFYWAQIEHFVESYQCVDDIFGHNDNIVESECGVHAAATEPGDSTDDYDMNDEVNISVGNEGVLVAKASQLDDYWFRPRAVEDLSLWENIARRMNLTMTEKTFPV
ncbi:hypothetical protein EV359DRAFT_75862 [Lentinula novae-zelandiae]|nr:hypothetical protein EV359DRAFT_75862 [Lentinula novae-zelandiae]